MTPVLDECQPYRQFGGEQLPSGWFGGGDVQTGTRGAAQGVIWEVSGGFKCVAQRLVLASFMLKTRGYRAAAFTAGHRFT